MKIGILTFHRAHNYGAVLQAYALQEVLKELGHDVKFIDHINKEIMGAYKIVNLRQFFIGKGLRFFPELYLLWYRYKRSVFFNLFIKSNLSIDSNIAFDSLEDNYDAIIVGSDQVWNYDLTGGFDEYYWANFKNKNTKIKIVSYAASMEVPNMSEKEKSLIARLLNNFDSIGVREDSLKEHLQPLTSRNINVVADPTLLTDINLWNKIAVRPLSSKPYLLLYQVRNNSKNEVLAKKVAEKLNLEIVYLSARIDTKNSSFCRSASPSEYLGLFKYASFVLCSSFHGTVFSTLFKVPFYSILMGDGKDSRSISLLKSLNLSDRAISYNDEVVYKPIDWSKVDEKRERIKQASINYLSDSLK
ncbi:polysaccharide pyruvyl transferase family protein [Aquirufa regiilacus]|uniref:Polysaccharide pyruvyl transferase family protein n=1 Tax=Aquirufa regiilacus TaxID=3024868 RepID=A0ABU3TSS4_9BACT|nr:polysaccharide pyruvyl transferase family protein [Aquirufa sp. LEOWEIH-7C]MDU0808908.1 polysaccharide pyruvyl transferase family protein [Aquirufa sp. LEOWEIH-7C]